MNLKHSKKLNLKPNSGKIQHNKNKIKKLKKYYEVVTNYNKKISI